MKHGHLLKHDHLCPEPKHESKLNHLGYKLKGEHLDVEPKHYLLFLIEI
jgi:hypothetical protein